MKLTENISLLKLILEAEEDMKKIQRDAFLYMDPKVEKDMAQCSTCIQWTGETCAIIGSDTKVTGDMSCGLYLSGEPNKDLLGKEKELVTAKEAGLVKRKVRCENCRSFDDSQNSSCMLFEELNKLPMFDLKVKVDKAGCCNAQMPKE